MLNRIKERYLINNIKRLIKLGRTSLLPPPLMMVSEWADKNRMLPETSVEPGKWRTERTPHVKNIMNAVNNPHVRQITVMGSSQIGKTEIINNIIGYKIDLDPCAIMVMQPTDKDVKDYVQLKLDPMIEDTLVLKNKVAKKKSRDADNNVYRKKFIGGWLIAVSGNSTSSTRARSAKISIGDDIDAIPIQYHKEGDPILRLIKRTTTYPDHLNINISTPTRVNESRIEALYLTSNMQRYYIECPQCKYSQTMIEEQLRWEKEKDMFGVVLNHYHNTAKYECEKCSYLINESERLIALANGEWRADKPSEVEHQGYFLNELSSTLSSMAKVAKQIINTGMDIKEGEFDYINASEEKVEALFNTVFGRCYSPLRGEGIEITTIMERLEEFITKEDHAIPNEVLLLTASVDLQEGMGEQEQRLEVNIWGWGIGEESWLLFRTRIPGNLKDFQSANSPWKKLDELFNKKFIRKDGISLKPQIKVIDSGYATLSVYEYTSQRWREGIYAIKGANKYGADLLPRKISQVNKKRTMLIVIGTQAAKQEIYGRLKNINEAGPKYTHFPKIYCDAEYFKQLTAEHGVKKSKWLMEYVVYEKKNKRDANEAIDLYVYAFAAMRLLNPNFEKIKKSFDSQLNNSQQTNIFDKTETVEKTIDKPTIKNKLTRNIKRRNFAKVF